MSTSIRSSSAAISDARGRDAGDFITHAAINSARPSGSSTPRHRFASGSGGSFACAYTSATGGAGLNSGTPDNAKYAMPPSA